MQAVRTVAGVCALAWGYGLIWVAGVIAVYVAAVPNG